MIRVLRTIILLTSLRLFSALKAQEMTYEDIVIVETTAKDLSLKIKSESGYYKNNQLRILFRRANISFLREAIPRARFIFIDMWYPDLLNNETDLELSEVLRSGKNITISGVGRHEGRIELAHPQFRNSVQEVGHIFFYNDDPETFQFPPVLCADTRFELDQLEECPEDSKLRHVAIIAAEGFLGKRLKHEKRGTYGLPRKNFLQFPRITFKQFQTEPELIKDKLVILINKPLPHMDTHKTLKRKTLTGSEIIAEMILFFANTFPPE